MHRTPKWLAAGAVLLVFAASAALAAVARPPAEKYEKEGPLHRIEAAGRAYSFDAAWRVESLWERTGAGTWRKVEAPSAADVQKFRVRLLHRLGQSRLEQVPAESGDALEALRSLGYL
jgi:hypothetical protein